MKKIVNINFQEIKSEKMRLLALNSREYINFETFIMRNKQFSRSFAC